MGFLSHIFGRNDQPEAQRPQQTFAPLRQAQGGALVLPAWAQVVESQRSESGKVSVTIQADTDAFMREWLALLGVSEPDQYWLEVAYQCAKFDLQAAIVGTELDPRVSGKSAEFIFTRAPQWAQKSFPAGKGAHAATQGREAREHYKRVRGRMPF